MGIIVAWIFLALHQIIEKYQLVYVTLRVAISLLSRFIGGDQVNLLKLTKVLACFSLIWEKGAIVTVISAKQPPCPRPLKQQRSPLFSRHAIAPSFTCPRSRSRRMPSQSQPCNTWLHLSRCRGFCMAISIWRKRLLAPCDRHPRHLIKTTALLQSKATQSQSDESFPPRVTTQTQAPAANCWPLLSSVVVELCNSAMPRLVMR